MSAIPEGDLVESLASRTCPACGEKKKPRETFCNDCYRALPKGQQHALYKRLRFGYAEAVAAAMKTLGRNVFRLPVPPVVRAGRQMGLFQ